MNTETKQLIELKERIEKAKYQVNKLEGQLESLSDTLKKELKCSTIKEAETLLNKMEKKVKQESSVLTEGINNLNKIINNNEH